MMTSMFLRDVSVMKTTRYPCPYCPKNFKTSVGRRSFRQHIRNEHETLNKNCRCPIKGCMRHFTRVYSLELHYGKAHWLYDLDDNNDDDSEEKYNPSSVYDPNKWSKNFGIFENEIASSTIDFVEKLYANKSIPTEFTSDVISTLSEFYKDTSKIVDKCFLSDTSEKNKYEKMLFDKFKTSFESISLLFDALKRN